jgi:hypothetical protein
MKTTRFEMLIHTIVHCAKDCWTEIRHESPFDRRVGQGLEENPRIWVMNCNTSGKTVRFRAMMARAMVRILAGEAEFLCVQEWQLEPCIPV